MVGDAAEILERLEVVLGDAVAFGIHAAELPLRQRVAFFGGVFERVDGLGLVAGLEPLRAGAERLHGGDRRRGGHLAVGLAAVERQGRRHGRHGHQAGTNHHNTQQVLSYPHNTPSRPPLPDG